MLISKNIIIILKEVIAQTFQEVATTIISMEYLEILKLRTAKLAMWIPMNQLSSNPKTILKSSYLGKIVKTTLSI